MATFNKSIRNSECTKCHLCVSAQFVCLIGRGKIEPDLMLVGEAPGEREDDQGKPFVGKAGKVLSAVLDTIGLSRDDVFIDNAVHCRPPNNRKPEPEEIEACRPYLDAVINQVNPKMILALGGVAAQSLLGSVDSVGSARNKVHHYGRWPVMVTYHPAATFHKASYAEFIVQDFKKAYQIATGVKPIEVRYIAVTPSNIQRVIERLRKAEAIGVDVETETLKTEILGEEKKLLTVSIAPTEGVAYWFPIDHEESSFDDSQTVISHLKEFFTNNHQLKINHNIKFDLKCLWKYGIPVTGPHFCTMVAYGLLNEVALHKSLDACVELFLNMDPYWEEVDQLKAKAGTRWVKEHGFHFPLKALGPYNCGDADAAFRLRKVFTKQLKEQGLWDLFLFLMKILHLFAVAEFRGIKIDRKEMKRLDEEYSAKLESLKAQLDAIKPMNHNSRDQVAEFVFGEMELPIYELTKAGQPSLNEKSVKYLSPLDETGYLPLLAEYRSLSKLKSTYIDGVRETMVHGRIYPKFHLVKTEKGTVTGRVTSSDPSFHLMPREGEIKRYVVSSFQDGRIVQADTSQAELRVMAYFSQDPGLMKIFREGKYDIHTGTAAEVYGIPPEKVTKQQRKFVKQVNFGIIYCITAFGLAIKLDCSQRKAQNYIDLWFKRFPRVKEWIHEQQAFVVENKVAVTPTGRIRHLPEADGYSGRGKEALRQGVNAPIQSFASDLTLIALYDWARAIRKRALQSQVFMNVYDANYADCPPAEVLEVAQLARTSFVHPPIKEFFDIDFNVPLDVEVKAGPNLKDMQVIGGLK